MSFVAVLIDQFAVAEIMAVEQTLVRARANWSLYGHLNYALSRAWSETDVNRADSGEPDNTGFCDTLAPGKACNPPTDDDLVTAYNKIFDEMDIVNWPYPNYTLRTSVPVASDIALNNDGKIRIQLSLAKNGDLYDFSGNGLEITRLEIPDMYVDLCVLSGATTAPTLSGTCGVGGTGDSGFSLVEGLYRNAPP